MPVGMNGEPSRSNQVSQNNQKAEIEKILSQDAQKAQNEKANQAKKQDATFVQKLLSSKAPAKLGMGLIAQSWNKQSDAMFKSSSNSMEKNINSAMESELASFLMGTETKEDSVQLSRDRLAEQQKEVKGKEERSARQPMQDPTAPAKTNVLGQAASAQKKAKSEESEPAETKAGPSLTDQVDTQKADDNARADKRHEAQRAETQQQAQNADRTPTPSAQTRLVAQAFVQAFTKKALGDQKTDSHDVNEMRGQLLNSGFSEKQVNDLEARVLTNARRNIETQLKDHILKQMLSKEGTLEMIKHTKEANQFVANAVLKNQKLGGFDFGGLHGGMRGMGEEVKSEARAELRDFFTEEFRATIIRGATNPDAQSKALAQLMEMKEFAQKVGFNFAQWSSHLPEEKVHLGLVVKDWEGALERHGLDDDGESKKRKPKPVEPPPTEEEVLEETVTALYIRLNIDRSIRNRIQSFQDLSALKKKMKAKGMNVEAILAKAQNEAMAVSKLKLLELLKELYAQRATLVELTGPTYDGIEKQISNYQKSIRRLGHEISDLETKSMRDEANHQVFQVSKNELMELQIKLKIEPANIFLIRKRQQVIKNLERLKKESNITDELYYDLSEQKVDFGQNTSISRGA